MSKWKVKKSTKPRQPEQRLDINCKFFPTKYKDLKDAPVMCTSAERLFSDKCERCGFNPIVKQQRLEKMFGKKRAENAVAYSKSITEGTNAEYKRLWGNYRPRKEEP